MKKYAVDLREAGKIGHALAGSKGAILGELSGIEGISVPEGFCVTSEVYGEILEGNAKLRAQLDWLSALKPGDAGEIEEICAEIRGNIERIDLQ